MPEGHSVHRLARQFNDVFAGAALAVSSPQGKFAAGAARIDGHKLEHAQAHGKQMFLFFSHELVMRVHLGLYGAWDFGGDSSFRGASSIGAPRRIGEKELDSGAGPDGVVGDMYLGPPEPKGAVRVRLISHHGWADLRGPTACEVLTPAESTAVLCKLGPDPLNDFPGDAQEFARRVRRSATSIALLLMKQEVLAGVGNVYRAEVLFRLGLDPMLPGKTLEQEEALAIWRDISIVMADGLCDGRIITTELVDRPTGLGAEVGHGQAMAAMTSAEGGAHPAVPARAVPARAVLAPAVPAPAVPAPAVPADEAHYVYKREGLPCRHCGSPIALKELGGRKLYWCPRCQGGR
ncbi:Fpg/Nei family DNA glycosylase [Arthrobacter antibioticus]|uniref:Fpg/Nei family DNA glycosylase n=1 Tax=Arthrobacter sp. H35-MC1 TaxID=3046203 RepID=UPI0024BBABFD|nr:DNA glycosylase [Arthrobacter sp. H35-MC1]MDJ0316017.1 zinc finger domain-containing protein [Arthrobacter sp. H35-MC1]